MPQMAKLSENYIFKEGGHCCDKYTIFNLTGRNGVWTLDTFVHLFLCFIYLSTINNQAFLRGMTEEEKENKEFRIIIF